MSNTTCSFDSFVVRNRLLWLVMILLVSIGLDQGTKYWAQTNLAHKMSWTETQTIDGISKPVNIDKYFADREIVVVPKAFSFVYKENPAAAFSITSSLPDWFRRPFLLIISALATLFFLIWYFRLKEADAILLSAFSLIMGGAIGNLIDRARLGYVVDFVDWHLAFAGYPHLHWPTFNIADSCIMVGATLLLLHSFLTAKARTSCSADNA